jgi:hypothetical protein
MSLSFDFCFIKDKLISEILDPTFISVRSIQQMLIGNIINLSFFCRSNQSHRNQRSRNYTFVFIQIRRLYRKTNSFLEMNQFPSVFNMNLKELGLVFLPNRNFATLSKQKYKKHIPFRPLSPRVMINRIWKILFILSNLKVQMKIKLIKQENRSKLSSTRR